MRLYWESDERRCGQRQIVEVKPETSYIDHLSLVVETSQGEIWMETRHL